MRRGYAPNFGQVAEVSVVRNVEFIGSYGFGVIVICGDNVERLWFIVFAMKLEPAKRAEVKATAPSEEADDGVADRCAA